MIQTCLLLLCSLASLCSETVKIDFGTADSPDREGFVRVTDLSEFTAGTGVGWVEKGALVARNVPVSREWKFSESTGHSDPPAIFTTDLSQDHVESTQPATLRVKLSPGAWRLWLSCGAAGGHPAQVWDVHVLAGGNENQATFSGPHSSRTQELDVKATVEHLDIRFTSRSRWLVNALILAPAAEWPEVHKTLIAPLERELFLLPEDELSKWKHTPHVDAWPLPEFTEEEQKRGLVVYHRHYLEPIWPDTKPKRKEIGVEVRAFAAQDEYEPMTFTILPLRDFGRVEVAVTDLTTTSGHQISAKDLDVRYVRYMHVRPNYRVTGVYYRAPDVLMPMAPQALKQHENFRIWLTVYVGAFTPEGIYTGSAKIAADGQEIASVPLKLRVLPFDLQRDRSLVIGQYYHHPYPNAKAAPDEFSRRWWRRKAELEHADMAAHGNNTLTMGVWSPAPVDGKWQFNFDDLAHVISLYERHGFYQPIPLSIPTHSVYSKHLKGGGMGSHLRLIQMPPPEFFKEMTDMVRVIEAERKQRRWPEFLYYPVDEPSTSETSVAFMTEVLKAIKQVPGVRTYVTADPVHEQFAPMRPYVDVWCCQPFNPDRETILADMKARGVEYWCYPNHVAGENDHTTVAGARMTYGFGLWRSGFRALIPWIYQAVIADPWNYLDGSAMDFFNRTGDDGEPIPVTLWEAYREGMDDHRYLTTLDAWIDRAKSAGLTELAASAEAERQFLWDSIQVQTKYKYDGLWTPEAFDVYRWLVANEILKLRAALATR